MKKKSGLLLKRDRGITHKSFGPKTLKPQNTRKIIRRFHVLLKNKATIIKKLKWNEDDYQQHNLSQPAQAFKYNEGLQSVDSQLIKLDNLDELELIKALGQIDAQIEKNGGLQTYQMASTQGQSNTRGSDSSKKLVEWLKDGYQLHDYPDLTALEIGCLRPDNFISNSKIFQSVTKIDLNSQHHLILQQDFMQRPLPKCTNEKFNLISCSLVLNFVSDPRERGEMLLRITKFLKSHEISILFLVLPLPCITNSRYLNNLKLLDIMLILGFTQRYHHESNKLAYWLFDWNQNDMKMNRWVKKTELAKGSNRNNFAIILKPFKDS